MIRDAIEMHDDAVIGTESIRLFNVNVQSFDATGQVITEQFLIAALEDRINQLESRLAVAERLISELRRPWREKFMLWIRRTLWPSLTPRQ